jgi:hypothetical protein
MEIESNFDTLEKMAFYFSVLFFLWRICDSLKMNEHKDKLRTKLNLHLAKLRKINLVFILSQILKFSNEIVSSELYERIIPIICNNKLNTYRSLLQEYV